MIGADDTPKLVWDLVENLRSNNYDVRPALRARSDSFRACADVEVRPPDREWTGG